MQWSVVSGQWSVIGAVFLAVCGGCVTTTVTSPSRGSTLKTEASSFKATPLRVTVNATGMPFFDGRPYTANDLAKALQTRANRGRIVELVGQDGVTESRMTRLMTELRGFGVYNIIVVMPRRPPTAEAME
ncbi:MAG: hypothetical protein FWF84_03580 [Kiritimatiellaeota bacterium]|nr:hypothetical protein [Kiritimatiellota bacterium]